EVDFLVLVVLPWCEFLLAAVPLEAEVTMQPVLSGGPRSDSTMLSPPEHTLMMTR
ncbi:hypothetical protein KUCAC02_020547, partial [Chaenocephalus aceratus]